MPTVTIELPRTQLDEVEAYASSHQLTVAEVLSRALERFLALACIEPDEVSLMSREETAPCRKSILDRDL
jgi:hypothetical protein